LLANVTQTCPNALAGLADVTATRRVQAAAAAFGHELDGDLSLAWLSQLRTPLSALSSALAGLGWGSAAAATASGFVSAEQALIGVRQSNLCQDAFRLAGHPATIPAGTRSFLSRYGRGHAAVISAETAFGSLLRRDAPSSASELLSNDEALEAQYATATAGAERTQAGSILSELGFS
jgi:hypothetical protein